MLCLSGIFWVGVSAFGGCATLPGFLVAHTESFVVRVVFLSYSGFYQGLQEFLTAMSEGYEGRGTDDLCQGHF